MKGKADDAAMVQLSVGELRSIIRSEIDAALSERDRAPALLNLRGLAEKLGVSERSLLDMRKQGMPHTMIGDSPRFELAQVTEWLQLQDVREIAAALTKYRPLESAALTPDNVKEIGKRARVAMPLLKVGQEIDLGGGVKISKAKRTTK